MKIVFMGTPEHSALVLRELIKRKHQLLCAVTRPDRPKGRGQKVAFSPVKETALKHDIPVEQPEKIKGNSVFIETIRSLEPDLIVVVAYGRILPKEILDIPKRGCLNVHASLLPKYRGAAPVQWALLNGEKETGITIMRINEGLDTGDIAAQKKIRIKEDDDAALLMDRLFKEGCALLLKSLEEIESGKIKYLKQDEARATYAPALAKESGEIDWRKPAREIHNRVRALVPWPVAHTFFRGKTLRIFKSGLHMLDLAKKDREPGTIVEVLKNSGFIVATGKGDLLVEEVQMEAKRRMGAYNFVIGHDVKNGETLPN